jgi:hypothetical protein
MRHAFAICALVGCGSTDVHAPPSIRIAFPAEPSAIDADHIHVHGSAVDDDGIAEVTVDGRAATLRPLDDGNIVAWSIDLPLSAGLNDIVVRAVDRAGDASDDVHATVRSRSLGALQSPRRIDLGPKHFAILTDDFGGMFALDLTTGARSHLGEACFECDVTVDAEANQAYVLGSTVVARVDLATGTATPVAGGQGVFLESVAVDAARNRLLVAGFRGVDTLDLATGVRAPFAEIGETDDVAIADNRAYAIKRDGALIAIDLASAARTTIRPAPAAESVNLRLGIDASHSRAYLGSARGIEVVDLGTGATAPLPGGDLAVRDVLYDPSSDRLLVVAEFAAELVTIDLATGVRARFDDSELGSGPIARFAFAGVPVPGRDAQLLLDGGQLLRIDDATLVRTPIAEQLGNRVFDLAVIGDRIVAVDGEADAVVAVDPDTGARTVVSGAGRGRGPALDDPSKLASDDGHLFVLDRNGVVAIDVATGDRTLSVGNVSASSAAVDGARSRLLVASDICAGNIMAIAFAGDGSCVSIGVEIRVVESIAVAGDRAYLGAIDAQGNNRLVELDLATGAGRFIDDGRGSALHPNDLFVDPVTRELVVIDGLFGLPVFVDLDSHDRVLHARP